MARKRTMSQREVDALKKPGMTCMSDNLYLQIRDQGTRSWLYRYWVDRKPKVIGLVLPRILRWQKPATRPNGCASRLGMGLIPQEKKAKRSARKAERAAASAASAALPSFKQCAREYIRSHEASWKNDRHRAQWSSTMKAYAYPVIGKKRSTRSASTISSPS